MNYGDEMSNNKTIYDEEGMLSDEQAERIMILSGVKPTVASLTFSVLKMRRNGDTLKKIGDTIGYTSVRVAQLEKRALKFKRCSHVFFELSMRSRNGILIYYTNEKKIHWPTIYNPIELTVEPHEVLDMINRCVISEKSNHIGVKSMNQINEWIKRHCA